jgi:integrase/recombinase XerD
MKTAILVEDIELFRAWLESTHSPLTVDAYCRAVRQFCKWLKDDSQEEFNISDLTTRDGVRYREYLQKLIPPRSPSTINVALSALSAWGSWSIELGIRSDNPFTTLKRVEDTSNEVAPKALSSKQQAALLRAARNTRYGVRDEAIITICLQTGVRVSELCALKWSDLTIGERSGWLKVHSGKGNKLREIPLSITARRAIWRWALYAHDLLSDKTSIHRERWNHEHATILQQWITAHPNFPLFTSQKAGAIHPRTVQESISSIAQTANLSEVTPHVLRHSFATDLINAGVPITVIAHLLGHRSLITTQIYTKPNKEDLLQAVDLLKWE